MVQKPGEELLHLFSLPVINFFVVSNADELLLLLKLKCYSTDVTLVPSL